MNALNSSGLVYKEFIMSPEFILSHNLHMGDSIRTYKVLFFVMHT